MTYREILLVLHIVGAGTWLGANIVQAVVPPIAARSGTAALAGWYRVTAELSRRLYMPAAILILLTGVALVLESEAYGFGSIFVTVGFGMIIIGAILGIVVFGPAGESAAEAVESEDHPRIKSAVSRLTTWGLVDTLLLLFTITAMVIRLD
jgi:hypothetical protein